MKETDEQETVTQIPEALTEPERLEIAQKLTLKAQGVKVLEMKELMDFFSRGLEIAEAKRDTTVADEHFVWLGRAIQAKELFTALKDMAEYRVPVKEKKSGGYV